MRFSNGRELHYKKSCAMSRDFTSSLPPSPLSPTSPVAVTDGRIVSFAVAPYRQDEVDLIRKLTGERVPATVGAALRRRLQPYRFALRNSLRNLPCGSH